MHKKLGKATNLLLLLVFILIAILSVMLTVKFITPPEKEETETTTEIVTNKKEEDKDESSVGTLKGNVLQHYENDDICGLVACDNKYIFKYQIVNKQKCLTRTKIKDMSMDVVLSGYEIKSLNIIKNNLYMVMEQYTENSYSQVIAYMNVDKTTLNTINATRTKEIISFASDGKNIYYTIKEDYCIYKLDQDQNVTKLYNTNSKGDHPFIIGITQGKIYYVNGIELCSLGIRSKTNTVLSTQYCSVDQYPILNNDHIIVFYDLAHTRLDTINLDGTYKQTLVEKGLTPEIQSRIDSVNYSCGYIFLLTDGKIYYLDKDYTINQLTEATPKTSQMYLTDEYLILEDKEYGNIISHKIVWLLAS